MTTTIIIKNANMSFSAGHFTIFSATHRERLHGHNYEVIAKITTQVDENGLAFDYKIFEEKLTALAKSLNSYFLLPEHSPHLTLEKKSTHYEALFNNEVLRFPINDVKLLAVRNVTIEELSQWFLERLLEEHTLIDTYPIGKIKIKVGNGPAHFGSATWVREQNN